MLLTCLVDSSTVSQTLGLQVQTLLNPSDDSPSRSSIPETPSSARYPSGFSQSSQVRHHNAVQTPSNITVAWCSTSTQSRVRQPIKHRCRLSVRLPTQQCRQSDEFWHGTSHHSSAVALRKPKRFPSFACLDSPAPTRHHKPRLTTQRHFSSVT
jgi:hypothetical protein